MHDFKKSGDKQILNELQELREHVTEIILIL
jgi:hypothetical protein